MLYCARKTKWYVSTLSWCSTSVHTEWSQTILGTVSPFWVASCTNPQQPQTVKHSWWPNTRRQASRPPSPRVTHLLRHAHQHVTEIKEQPKQNFQGSSGPVCLLDTQTGYITRQKAEHRRLTSAGQIHIYAKNIYVNLSDNLLWPWSFFAGGIWAAFTAEPRDEKWDGCVRSAGVALNAEVCCGDVC